MNQYELTDDLLTGNDDIDEQHRMLLKIGNGVIELSRFQEQVTVFEEALQFLSDYTVNHFMAEDHIMSKFNYPNYGHHRAWHDRFKQEISDIVKLVAKDELSHRIQSKVSYAIENWLKEHIMILDRALAKFIKQQEGNVLIRLPIADTVLEAGKLPPYFDRNLPAGQKI